MVKENGAHDGTKKRRRGHGEGAVYQRESDGKWVGVVDLGYVGGKRKRKVVYGQTRKEAGDKLRQAQLKRDQGLAITDERHTVADFLTNWLDASVKPTVRPKTHRSYSDLVRLHIAPAVGRKQLTKLQPADVQAMMNAILAAGFSARTANYCRVVLRIALNQAVKWWLIARNVAALVDPVKPAPRDKRYLTPQEARRFLDAAAGHRHETLFVAALSTGLRQGELLGLRWQDVDFEAGTLTVRHALQRVDGTLTLVAPKSASSRRAVPLPEVALVALRKHRTRQLEERLAAGPHWQDADYVFTTTIGTPLDARGVIRHFHALREEAGLPWLRFHDLRHGFASLLAAQGVHPRLAMELLGHSEIALTMEVYTHVAPELAREAAGKIDAALGS